MGQGLPGKFGKCKVIRQLGQGATAVVFLAKHEGLGMLVAVKVLRKRLSESRPEYAERFLREARMAARLDHPNIVRVIDCGVNDGYHFMVMDYVDGRNCMEILREHSDGMPWRDATDIVLQTTDALQYAAEQDIIHRDVKPSNIMLDNNGRVRVTDLGLAKLAIKGVAALTQELHTVGTPNYMSPEQIRSPAQLDLRADIYSLGASYYHLVTGRPPFIGDNPMDVVTRHLTEQLVPPYKVRRELPAAVSKVICKMMAKSRKRRYQDYQTLREDLRNLQSGNEVTALDFRETYTTSEDDEKLVKLLERLSAGISVEVDEEEDVDGSGLEEEGGGPDGSSSLPPFSAADRALYRPPGQGQDSTIVSGPSRDEGSALWIIFVVAAIGVLILIALAALTAYLGG
ncbi:MAG: serine/threonine-protein kinase [Candidatus Brocadiia bacterium]